MLVDFGKPCEGVLEGFFAGEIKDDASTGDSFVVGASDRYKGFRASLPVQESGYCVPYLQLDVLTLELHCLRRIFHPDRDVVLLFEPLISKLQQQTGLAHGYFSQVLLPVSPIKISLNKYA